MTNTSTPMMPSGVACPVARRDEEADAYRACALLARHGLRPVVLADSSGTWLVCVDSQDADRATRYLEAAPPSGGHDHDLAT